MRTGILATTLGLSIFLTGCCCTDHSKSSKSQAKSAPTAVAVLSPAAGKPVAGKVTFTSQPGGVRVVADIAGLTPGLHGFHIHEKGDCSAADFTSAGGHFNPLGAKHGAPTDAERHVGDFGNIEADASGRARLDQVFSWLTFTGTNSILGRAVIVHDKPDDLKTQPTGNAGGRIACGVIQSVP